MRFDTLLHEQEVVDAAAPRWWLFLLTGIAWLVFALVVFQWDYTTVYAISYLFGVVAVLAGVNEFLLIGATGGGWTAVHGLVGVLFVLVGIAALAHPNNAFRTLAGLIGFFFLCKGVFDLVVAFRTKGRFDVWWLQLLVGLVEILLAFWVAGAFERKTILLVVSVGVIALTRGFTEILVAFELLARAGGGGPPLRPA
jgi:uncharacterized membrane protein HdeD (DUF308 family)